MTDSDHERSLYEARLDAQYYEIFHLRNARFFSHLRTLFSIILLVSGTAAFTLMIRADELVAAVVGSTIAILTILDHVIGPAARVVKHEHQAAQFAALLAEGRGLDLEAFDAQLAALRTSDDVNGLDVLRCVAYNDNVNAAGRESYAFKLTPWQRFAALLA